MSCVLLIDDDRALLKSAQGAAQAAGVHLDVAASWEEGLALFHVLNPDLVIADYNMPGSRHGLQLLAEIRQMRPSVRLVLVSGYLSDDEMRRVHDLGVVDRTLTKGSAVETAREIVMEAEAVANAEPAATDWGSYAQSFVDASSVSPEDLDALDKTLRPENKKP